MTFISYAQNFEDVVLRRALAQVETGFYIDVGANDPEVDSVTKAFYEQGWHGINIEPLASHWDDLQRERPRDINLKCAAGDSKGELELWEADVRGWATLSPDVVSKHTNKGHRGQSYKVPVTTLTEVCAEHVQGEIHFLKIDVEGFEASVLKGMDFSRFRPWIVVVEATEPDSTVENHQTWEPELLACDYQFVYADGLNRYYLADEHANLKHAFKYPPNVFDDFKPAVLWRIEQLNAAQHDELSQANQALQASQARCNEIEQALVTARTELQTAYTDANALRFAAQTAQAKYHEVLNSTSWRILAPLRWGVDQLRSGLTPACKQTIKRLLERAAHFVNRRPALKHQVMRVLNRFPRIKSRLSRVVNQSFVASTGHHAMMGEAEAALTPYARQVLTDLKAARERQTHSGVQ